MLTPVVISFLVSLILQKIIISFSHQFQLVARPDQRRRHDRATPSIGGIGLLLGWFVGLWAYSTLHPGWAQEHYQSLVVIVSSTVLLNTLGLWDDIFGAGPYFKLFFQSVVGFLILKYEPSIHTLLLHWQDKIGIFSWILGYLWIIGITNAVNLIDGIDGLAGGMSALSCISLIILLNWAGDFSSAATVYAGVLLPPIIAFLVFNWNPAKIFLGDNGSLPVGMILSSVSLMGHTQTNSWIMILSYILIFGYPILDVAICVLRRYQKRQAFFKGDRIHLHFRIIKLGLNVRQTTTLLLIIGLYLQITAIAVNLMSIPAAILAMTVAFLGLFTLLFMIRSIESWKVSKTFSYIQKKNVQQTRERARSNWSLTIDLSPILEKSPNQQKAKEDILSLENLVRTLIRNQDSIILSDAKIIVGFNDTEISEPTMNNIHRRFQDKINNFIHLFNIECTTSTLPIEVNRNTLILYQNENVAK